MSTEETTATKTSKNSVDAYGAEGKTNVLMFDPDKLIIVEDKNHPLYDRRIEKPLTEMFIANVDHYGIHTPGSVRKNPETGDVEVVFGRRRVRAAREVNKRRRAKGIEPLMQVPMTVKRGDDSHLTGLMVSENESREEDTPMNRAEKMQRMLSQGKDEAHIAMAFEVNVQTVKQSLALLEATAAVRNAVESGKISVSAAHPLVKLTPEEQRSTLETMLAAGEGETGPRKRARKMREAAAANGTGAAVMRGKREIKAYLEKVNAETTDPDFQKVAKSILEWVLGDRVGEPRVPKDKSEAT